MRFDHVAIPSKNIPDSVAWYQAHFGATVLYQDATWAFLQLGGTYRVEGLAGGRSINFTARGAAETFQSRE